MNGCHPFIFINNSPILIKSASIVASLCGPTVQLSMLEFWVRVGEVASLCFGIGD